MTIGRRIAGFAAATALLGSLAAPAEAQWRGGYRHRGGGDTVGNILLGGVIGGVLVAAASASRNRTVKTVSEPLPNDLPPPPIAPPGAYPAVAQSGQSEQGEAVDTCTAAAENGARARVERITHVADEGGAWRVEGELDDGGPQGRSAGRFTCATAEGRVLEFRLDDGRGGFAPRRGPAL